MSLSPEEQEQKRASEAIDRRIRVELKDYENTIKILLLGLFTPASFVRGVGITKGTHDPLSLLMTHPSSFLTPAQYQMCPFSLR